MKQIFIAIVALLIATSATAEQFYVTDSFRAPLRSGQTNKYRIVAQLKSGARVTVVERNAETGYSKVRTPKGTEGWILTRYLLNQPIARERLIRAEKRLQTLTQDKTSLASRWEEMELTAATLKEDNETLKELNNKMLEELNYIKQVSANTLNINQRNQQLIQENEQLRNDTQLLTGENERLESDTKQEYLVKGAGIMLLGLIIGVVLPRIRTRRKDTGWV